MITKDEWQLLRYGLFAVVPILLILMPIQIHYPPFLEMGWSGHSLGNCVFGIRALPGPS